ncbi:hypothetical protein SGPA1_11168 [Streptomyces misionensis JCM 4497]
MRDRLPKPRRAPFGNGGHGDDMAAAGTARPVGRQGAHFQPSGPGGGPGPGGGGRGHRRARRPHPAPRPPRRPRHLRDPAGVRRPHRAGTGVAARRRHPRSAPTARPGPARPRSGRPPFLHRGARRASAHRRPARPRVHQRQARPLLRPPGPPARRRAGRRRGEWGLGGHPSGWTSLRADGARPAVRLRLRACRDRHRQGGPGRGPGGPGGGRGVPWLLRFRTAGAGRRTGGAFGGGRAPGGRAGRRTHGWRGAALGGHRRPCRRAPLAGHRGARGVVAAAPGELRRRGARHSGPDERGGGARSAADGAGELNRAPGGARTVLP